MKAEVTVVASDLQQVTGALLCSLPRMVWDGRRTTNGGDGLLTMYLMTSPTSQPERICTSREQPPKQLDPSNGATKHSKRNPLAYSSWQYPWNSYLVSQNSHCAPHPIVDAAGVIPMHLELQLPSALKSRSIQTAEHVVC